MTVTPPFRHGPAASINQPVLPGLPPPVSPAAPVGLVAAAAAARSGLGTWFPGPAGPTAGSLLAAYGRSLSPTAASTHHVIESPSNSTDSIEACRSVLTIFGEAGRSAHNST